MPKHTCCWLMSEPCKFPATYCGKPVSYSMATDDDGNRVRKYQHLCDEHLIASLQIKDEDDDV